MLPTIFEPFVTTKGETGTGLGLWVTAEILRKNGWTIRACSSCNRRRSGTAFSIQIPRIHAPARDEAHIVSGVYPQSIPA